MWATEPGWTDALSGDHTPLARVTVLYDGRVTLSTEDDASDIIDGSLTRELMGGDNPQIATSLDLTIDDPTGELYTGLPESRIGWWGHRLQVQSGIQVGDWEQWVPDGTLRVESIQPDAVSRPSMYPGGQWVRGPQTLKITASDLLEQVADERLMQPTSPPAGATVRSEVARLAAGIVPMAPWAATQGVPASLAYDDHDRLGIIVSLCRVAGRVPVMSRVATLDAIPATGSGARWMIPLTALIEASPSGSRDGLRNGWVVTSETESQQPLRGQALEPSGLLRWGGPFGRVPAFAHSPILTTNAACAAAAATNRTTDIASRRQDITITTIADPALDVLDTAVLTMPGQRSIEALITRIRRPLAGGVMEVTASAPLEVLR